MFERLAVEQLYLIFFLAMVDSDYCLGGPESLDSSRCCFQTAASFGFPQFSYSSTTRVPSFSKTGRLSAGIAALRWSKPSYPETASGSASAYFFCPERLAPSRVWL